MTFNMNNLSLDSLLEGLTKQAAEDEGKKTSGDDGEGPEVAKKEEPTTGAQQESPKKKEDEDEDDDEGQEKAAALKLQAALQKTASHNVNHEENMTSQAKQIGAALADQLLVKLAYAGDENTADGVAVGSIPQKIIQDDSAIVHQDDTKIQGMPGAGGSVNQIFDSIVADTLAQGSASYDQAHTTGVTPVEGIAAATASPEAAAAGDTEEDDLQKTAALNHLVQNGFDFESAYDMVKQAEAELAYEQDQFEKQAALQTLVGQGYDFADAVNLIKQAEYELEAEHEGQVKQAALETLIAQGVDFDTAADLVKEAGLGSKIGGVFSRAGKKVGGAASRAGNSAKGFKAGVTGNTIGHRNSPNVLSKPGIEGGHAAGAFIRRNAVPIAAGAGGLAAGALLGTAAAGGREKSAAVAALVNQGVDFDSAVGLVEAKAAQLYGA
jgi:hypothetical protein